MKRLRDISIRWKLTFICMICSLFALTISSLAFYAYELRELRAETARQHVGLAQATAPLFATPLDFLDAQHAQQMLGNLLESPDVVAACLYDPEGLIFAAQARSDVEKKVWPLPPANSKFHYSDDMVFVFEPVVSRGERVGTIFLQVQLKNAFEEAVEYAKVLSVVALLSIVATFVFSTLIIRVYSRPIVELARKTKLVTEQKNYSIRAEKFSNDELGDLIDSFNAMLRQIQERDIQLEKHGEMLEAEVEARTDEIRKLSLALEKSPYTAVITDSSGYVEYVNQEFYETSGYTLEEALEENPAVVTTGLMTEQERDEVLSALARDGEWQGLIQNRKKNGEMFWESVSIARLQNSKGENSHYVWAKEDITERKRSEDALRESEDRYALAVQGANDGLWDWDLRTNAIYYSPRWKAMLGYEDDEIGDSPEEWFSRVDQHQLEAVQQNIKEHLEGKTPHFEGEFKMRHKDGSYRWILSRGVSVSDEEGNSERFAGSQTDITMRKEAEERLFFDASHDVLTGLPNRGLFLERLSAAIQLTKRNSEIMFAVLFLDLDRFKVINDSLGHAAGDELLIEASKRLKICVRDHDVVARMGGDEFAVLLERIESDKDSVHVAERIQNELTAPFMLSEGEVFTSVSIGIALSTQGYENAESLLRDSDAAMYRAKSLGKARFAMFDSKLHEQALRRLQIENDLRRAIEHHELEMYYQPIVSVRKKTTTGFEALIRWNHPEKGLVPPGEFIAIAEETGLIVPMGWWILEESCRQLAEWLNDSAMPDDLTVNVNISGKQILHGDFVQRLKETLLVTGIHGSSLRLELTETVIIESPVEVAESMSALRALDVQLCIDDFGTGYSSLSYLHQFPFDVLKIDRSFVATMASDPESLGIVQAIIALGKNLGLGVVGEGVETEEEFELLRKLKCDSVQGYLFARPMPAGQVPEFLAKGFEVGSSSAAK